VTLTRSAPLKRKAPLKRVSSKKRKKTSWRSVKRDPLDILWSKVVRARDGHTCQGLLAWRKGDEDWFYDGAPCGRAAPMWQIDAAHRFSRRKKSVRWHLGNGIALCKVCHDWAHRNERAFLRWSEDDLGGLWEPLVAQSKSTAKVDRDEVRVFLRARLRELEGRE
jgi:hypothetical protein